MEENKISFKEKWFRVYEKAHIGIFESTLDGKIEYCNKTYLDVLGYSSLKDFKKHIKNLKEIYVNKNERDLIIKDLKLKKSLSFQTKMFKKDGSIIHVQITASCCSDGLMIGFLQDISCSAKTQEKLEETLDAAVSALSKLSEIRDPYTAGHMRNVSTLSVEIGKYIGMPNDQLQCLRYGSLLHDIGKIYVPSDILTKPSRLTEKEYALVQEHPLYGYKILKDVPFICTYNVAEIILYHHERLDGSGYPKGLKDEEISIFPRIVAVADILEAMYHHRPYKPGKPLKKCLKTLDLLVKENKIDGEIVEICKNLFLNEHFYFNGSLDK